MLRTRKLSSLVPSSIGFGDSRGQGANVGSALLFGAGGLLAAVMASASSGNDSAYCTGNASNVVSIEKIFRSSEVAAHKTKDTGIWVTYGDGEFREHANDYSINQIPICVLALCPPFHSFCCPYSNFVDNAIIYPNFVCRSI